MKIEIRRCPSGWYAVFVDGVLWNGAARTQEDAERIASQVYGRNSK